MTKPDKTQPPNQTQTPAAEPDKKKPVDRSPENNLREALKLCRQARAKMVTKGDEKTGDMVKDIIEQLAEILAPPKPQKTEPAAPAA